jgi:hypothetical protein
LYFIKNKEGYINNTGAYNEDLNYSYSDFATINRFGTSDKDKSKCTFVNCTVHYNYYNNNGELQKVVYPNVDISL